MHSGNRRKICIVGSGTAGLLASIMLRRAFPHDEITNISSSKIGIIGVGEGSTEHWKEFMELCDIGVDDLITNTSATHKYGIRFENWTRKRPDYFHSVSGPSEVWAAGLYGEYLGFLEEDKSLTSQTGGVWLVNNQVVRENMHNNTNQFHFDTHQLNDFLIGVCFKRMIRFIDDEVANVKLSTSGYIDSVDLKSGQTIEADVWIDATGFSRILMTAMGNTEWKSFSDYLACDSAIAFPTESDPNGQIRPYTRARAATSGWMWEIPTQERRGNGYVYSSKFLTEEQAVAEAESMAGYKIEKHRSFKFDPGYTPTQWFKNCISIGLASSFVEPLEATSIGSTIIQCRHLALGLTSFTNTSWATQADYNRKMKEMMENILDMIRLHYVSDRDDTPFWKHVSTLPISPGLQNMIDLWNERPPSHYDYPGSSLLMFTGRHFAHVMQGQNLINPEMASLALDNLGIRQIVEKNSDNIRHNRYSKEMLDHKMALLETVNASNRIA